MTDSATIQDLEAALKNARDRFSTLMENVVDGMVIIDATGTILSFNPGAEKIFGYTAEEVIGKPVETLMPEPYHSEHASYLTNYLTTSVAKIIGIGREVVGLRKNGETFPMDLAVGEMNSDRGRQFVGSIRDLTSRKEVEQELRQAHKMDALGQLTGGVAHDFNNLLAVLMMDLELLEGIVDSGTPAMELVREARDVVNSGAELTRRLLAFSRRQPLAPSVVDLNRLVTGMFELLRRTLGESIEIETIGPTDLWRTRADPGQVETVLLNLAINARDAMSNGGQLTIETSNAVLDRDSAQEYRDVAPGEYVRLSVTDTGAGMSQSVLDRAFDPFFTTKKAGAGSGLGLSMIYGFAKQSEGHVVIYSEVGRGTTVDLYLPRAKGDAEEVAENATRDDGWPAAIGEETVLIVEDHPRLRERATSLLKELGYAVIEADRGPEALLALERTPRVDLLFTDMIMPGGMDGAMLATEARRRYPDLKVLFTTGFAEDEEILTGRIERIGSLLRKPYSRADLARKIREALDRGK